MQTRSLKRIKPNVPWIFNLLFFPILFFFFCCSWKLFVEYDKYAITYVWFLQICTIDGITKRKFCKLSSFQIKSANMHTFTHIHAIGVYRFIGINENQLIEWKKERERKNNAKNKRRIFNQKKKIPNDNFLTFHCDVFKTSILNSIAKGAY